MVMGFFKEISLKKPQGEPYGVTVCKQSVRNETYCATAGTVVLLSTRG